MSFKNIKKDQYRRRYTRVRVPELADALGKKLQESFLEVVKLSVSERKAIAEHVRKSSDWVDEENPTNEEINHAEGETAWQYLLHCIYLDGKQYFEDDDRDEVEELFERDLYSRLFTEAYEFNGVGQSQLLGDIGKNLEFCLKSLDGLGFDLDALASLTDEVIKKAEAMTKDDQEAERRAIVKNESTQAK